MRKVLLLILVLLITIALSGSALAKIVESISEGLIAEQAKMLLTGVGLIGLAGIGRKKFRSR